MNHSEDYVSHSQFVKIQDLYIQQLFVMLITNSRNDLRFSKINDANQRFCCVDGHFKNVNMKEAKIICFSLGTLVSG